MNTTVPVVDNNQDDNDIEMMEDDRSFYDRITDALKGLLGIQGSIKGLFGRAIVWALLLIALVKLFEVVQAAPPHHF